MKKIHACQLTLKNIHALKKIDTGNLMTKKIPAARKFLTHPRLPITFLMVRP